MASQGQSIMWTLRPPRAAALLVSLRATACSTVTPLVVQDAGVFFPSGRVRVDLQRATPGGWFLEGAFSDTEGDDRQRVAGGQSVVVNGISFSGPDALHTDASLRVGELVVGRCIVADQARISIYGGVQTIALDLEVRSATQSVSDQRSSRSLLIGADLSVPLCSWLTVDGRADLSYSLSGDELAARQFEVGLGLLPAEHARLFVGLSYRGLAQVVAGNSDIELDFFGPAVGLRLDL